MSYFSNTHIRFRKESNTRVNDKIDKRTNKKEKNIRTGCTNKGRGDISCLSNTRQH